jgi:hypothetical protein
MIEKNQKKKTRKMKKKQRKEEVKLGIVAKKDKKY